jgi:ribonucleoside-triphosphate reductase
MLKSSYEEYIALSRYARWDEEKGRRESWDETTQRWADFWGGRFPKHKKVIEELRDGIRNTEVMPSMRSLMTAGTALDRDEVAGFNCSYVAVDNPRVFDETMYVLTCGTGLGFSVERQYITKLPEIAEEFNESDTTIIVRDSKIGWAKSYRELISLLYQGQIPKWDTSKVRPAGAKLKTFGGRASGPEPLEDLFQFTIEVFRNAAGRKLNSIEVHDIMCKIAEIVVVGGVRRSALISLSNLSDPRMRDAKSGQWWIDNGQRALANNSVCYTEKPDIGIFMEEWKALYDSKSGERGIFNREAANNLLPDRRQDSGYSDWGCNPCSEIVLRSKQFCNLSEVVIRPEDTLDTLKEKVRRATIIGTFQATLTSFRYLSSAWKKNTEEEALLGVSLTGIMDHPVMSGRVANMDGFPQDKGLEEYLQELKEVAVETNKEWASKLGINPATSITAVKPSGTVSQLVDSASGIHPRYSPYYIRTVRADKKDPLAQMMVEQGFPVEDDITKPDSGYVFSFPIKAPEGSVMRDDMSAIEQLELWKVYQLNWCEHKPSITVYVREHEWLEVGAWVYKHFDIVSGVSFLPHSDHSYKQAPYQEITEEEYNKWVSSMPEADWTKLGEYEKEDATTGMKEYACTSGACEIL